MPPAQTKLKIEFERRCDAGIARGLSYKEAWQEIQEKDPVFFDLWQNEPWEISQAAKAGKKPGGPRPVPTNDDDEDEDPDDDDRDVDQDEDVEESEDDDDAEESEDDPDDKQSTTPTPIKKDDSVKRKNPKAEQFAAAVAEKRRAGMNRGEAARAVAKEQPNLRAAWVDEANANARRPPILQSKAGAARTDFDAAVAAKMRTGLARHEAVCAVCKEQPQLRERFVAEANARR
jgi:hypothetical protein